MLFKGEINEKLILAVTLGLVAFGLVMLYSASSVLALKRFGDPAYFVKRQALWAGAGVIMMAALWKAGYARLRKLSPVLLVAAFVMLVAVLVPGIGSEINGSRRWIRLAGMSLQPSELAKPALVVFLAASLARRADRLDDFLYGLSPYLAVVGTFAFLIVIEPDFGTAASICAVSLCMLYAAGARPRHLLAVMLPAVPLMYHQLFMVGYRRGRLAAYLDPWSDPLGTGFQSIQSFLAFGSGGLTGKGLGEGAQKLLFLPEPHSDFIYSVVGEELGLIGAAAVLAAFVVLLAAGMRVARKARDPFGRNLAFGATVLVAMQAFINMGVATGLIPNKGMPLPFVSAGGSSLLVALVSVGMVLAVARAGGEGGETSPPGAAAFAKAGR